MSLKATFSSRVRSTAASGSQVYESARATHEYILFHYGGSDSIIASIINFINYR